MMTSFFLITLALQAASASAKPVPPGHDTEAQAVAAATALHRRMDGNGDGFVTPAEMAQFITKAMNGLPIPDTDATHPLPPQSAKLFTSADSDRDGRISLAEAVAAAKRDFALQDTNHDGLVSPEERMAFLQKIVTDGRTPEGVPLFDRKLERKVR